MSKYNIYKIIPEKTSELLKKIKEVNLRAQKPKNIDGYTLQLFFPEVPDEKDIPWLEQYKNFIDEKNIGEMKNKVYFAVLLISKNKQVLYAVSLGKSHFYLQEFCDLDFGINIGIRILNEKYVNSKNARLFGSTKQKSLIIYKPNTQIDIESGESVAYLKGKTIDESKWGKTLICGTSAYFSIKDFFPTSLPLLIDSVESKLKESPLFNVPRAEVIVTPAQIKTLDEKLIEKLKKMSEDVEVEEQTLSGVDFIFKKDFHFSVKINNSIGWIPLDDQTIPNVMKIFKVNEFVLSPENIDSIKIRATPDEGSSYTRNLRYFIDYVDEDHCFLNAGKWYKLNQDYISYLSSELDRITIEENPLTFSRGKYENFKNTLRDNEEPKTYYPEKYFNKILCTGHGFIDIDGKLENFGGFRLEVADLYKDNTIYHVKIGNLQRQNYVLQQCEASLKYLKEHKFEIMIDGEKTAITTICLWCILDKGNHIHSLNELHSFIFLSGFLECYKAIRNAGLEPKIIIGYKE